MSFFMRRVLNHSEAEDLTQEVFVRMVTHADTLGAAPDSYVFQIAANLLQDRARRDRVRTSYREAADPAEDRDVDPRDPHRIAAGRAALSVLAESLAQMPERRRHIFVLYRLEGLEQREIAASLNISSSLVKQEVAKAMAFIVKRMRTVQ